MERVSERKICKYFLIALSKLNVLTNLGLCISILEVIIFLIRETFLIHLCIPQHHQSCSRHLILTIETQVDVLRKELGLTERMVALSRNTLERPMKKERA